MSFLLNSSFFFLTLKATLSINTIGCTSYLNDLARNVGKPLEQVILFEGAKILGQCIQKTPARARDKIRRQVEFRNRTLWSNGDPERPKDRGSFVAGFGKHGEGWLFETSNFGEGKFSRKGYRPKFRGSKTFHPMEFFHWSDPRWARWQSHLAAIQAKLHNVAQHLRSQGVSKATWLSVARDLGIEHLVTPAPPGYVKNAVSRDGRVYKHGYGRKLSSAAAFYIELENNSNLVLSRLDGSAILQRAVNGRRSFFLRNVELGVFETAANISRRYPGITVL